MKIADYKFIVFKEDVYVPTMVGAHWKTCYKIFYRDKKYQISNYGQIVGENGGAYNYRHFRKSILYTIVGLE